MYLTLSNRFVCLYYKLKIVQKIHFFQVTEVSNSCNIFKMLKTLQALEKSYSRFIWITLLRTPSIRGPFISPEPTPEIPDYPDHFIATWNMFRSTVPPVSLIAINRTESWTDHAFLPPSPSFESAWRRGACVHSISFLPFHSLGQQQGWMSRGESGLRGCHRSLASPSLPPSLPLSASGVKNSRIHWRHRSVVAGPEWWASS